MSILVSKCINARMRDAVPHRSKYVVQFLSKTDWYFVEFDNLNVAEDFARYISRVFKTRLYCRTVQCLSLDF